MASKKKAPAEEQPQSERIVHGVTKNSDGGHNVQLSDGANVELPAGKKPPKLGDEY